MEIVFNGAEFSYDDWAEVVGDTLFDSLNRTGMGDVLGAAKGKETWDIGVWVPDMEKGLEVIRTTLQEIGCPSSTEIRQDQPKRVVHRLWEREGVPIPKARKKFPIAKVHIRCRKCAKIYTLGQDALVVTQAQVMSDFQRVMIVGKSPFGVDTSSAPDQVGSLQEDWQDLDLSTIQEQCKAIKLIRSDLGQGRNRWWKCYDCGKKQRYESLPLGIDIPEKKVSNAKKVRHKGKKKCASTTNKTKVQKTSRDRRSINRVEICFDSELPPSSPEEEAVEKLVRYFDLPDRFTDDVDISTSYGKVPGVGQSLQTRNCSEELMRFVIVRGTILGMESIDRIVPRPFTYEGIMGVLIAGRVKAL